jgi:hypothetical protein
MSTRRRRDGWGIGTALRSRWSSQRREKKGKRAEEVAASAWLEIGQLGLDSPVVSASAWASPTQAHDLSIFGAVGISFSLLFGWWLMAGADLF